jgi:hypothetical protein
MPPSSDIVLVGAGRSPHTKSLRRQNGFPQRNFYLGTLQIRTGMRVPVEVDFVKQHYDEIVKRVEAGTLLVEYRFDTFVDPKELGTLAFGSEEDRTAYEKEVVELRDAAVAELMRASEAKHAEDEEASRIVPIDTPADGEPLYDNLEGSHEAIDVSELEVGRSKDFAAESEHDEPEESAVAVSPERADDPNFQPLPDGWRSYTKSDLLALCAERGIDASDMPSNRELRRRLDAYLAGT